MNIQKMMKEARRVQEEMERRLSGMRAEGSAGGGMVTAVVDGRRNLLSLTIRKEVVDPAEVEMLQDLIVAAVAEAGRRVDEESKSLVGGLLGGLPPLG